MNEKRASSSSLVEVILVVAVLLFGASQMASMFVAVYGAELNPDLTEFMAGVRGSTFFFDSGIREPLHVFFLKIGTALFAPEERGIRLTTVFQTLFACLGVFFCARRFIGPMGAAITLLAFSLNPLVLFYGVSGMRAPLFTGLVAWSFFAAHRYLRAPSYRRSLVFAASCALTFWTRSYGLAGIATLFLFFVATFFFSDERAARLKELAAAAICVAVSVVLGTVFRSTGHVSLDVTRMHNFELRGAQTVLPGDRAIGMAEYFLEGRTFTEIVWRCVSNYGFYLSEYAPRFFRSFSFMVWLIPVALVVALLTRRWLLASSPFIALGPMVFVIGLDLAGNGRYVENRLVYPVFPFVVMLLSFAGLAGVGYLLEHLANRDTTSRFSVLWRRVAPLIVPPPAKRPVAKPVFVRDGLDD